MVQLQLLCKILYKRVEEWLKFFTIYRHIKIRRSEVACFSFKKDLKVIEFPTETMIDDWCGIPPVLVGFQHYQNERGNTVLNVVLSNGKKKTRFKQGAEEFKSSHPYMLPDDTHKAIRSVRIYFSDCIHGFSFLDKKGALIQNIGTTFTWESCLVLLDENEIIVGLVVKYDPSKKVYTNWQFQIAKLESPLNLDNIYAVGKMEKRLNELCNTGKFKNYFHRLKKLGKGRFWEIWEVMRVSEGKTYAVKIVKFNLPKTSDLYSDL